MPNVLSPRDLVFRPDNMDETVSHGYYSAAFHVLQGTRQGGVISPFMYLCFVDELLDELNACDVELKGTPITKA